MNIENNLIVVCKQSMDDFEIISNGHYSMGYYLETAPGKDIGEDGILIHFNKNNLFLAVCDGVGGSDRSYRATKNTLNILAEMSLQQSEEEITHEIMVINQKLMSLEGRPQTTLTAASINYHDYTAFQIGDSGLIHCSNHGNLKYKSPMHSPIGKAVENHQLTEKAALQHPDLNIVDNVLGCDDCYVDLSSKQEIKLHDTLFLASDGLLDNFTTDEIISIISKGDLKEVCVSLTTIAKSKTNLLTKEDLYKLDDISFICLKHS